MAFFFGMAMLYLISLLKLTHFSAIEQNSRIISTIIDLPNSWVSNFEFHSIIYYFAEVFLYS